MSNNKLQAKDLINVGIFTAIYFVVFFACGMLGYIPIFMVLIPFICPLVAGIPMMLYLTKVKKFGMITITGLICGLLFMLTGHSPLPAITGIVFAFLGDLVMKSGQYKSSKKLIVGYGVFSLWMTGMLVPLFIMSDSYYQSLVANYGLEYATSLLSFTPMWAFPIFIALAFVGGILGGILGKAVLKKHFSRAGIA